MAGHFSGQQRQDFVELLGGLDARVHRDFQIRIHLACLLEEAEGKARANAERILPVNAAAREAQLDLLARGAHPRDVWEKNRAGEDFGGRFFGATDNPDGERRPRRLVVPQLDFSEHGLFGKNVLWQIEFELDAGEHDARKHAGNQNTGEQTGENQEKQIVAGVDRGQNQYEDGGEIDDAVARQAIVNLIGDPAQAGAPRERRHNGDGYPRRDSQRNQSGDAGEPDATFLSGGGGKQRDEKSDGQREDGDAEIAPAGAVACVPHSRDDGIVRGHRRIRAGRGWYRGFRGGSLRSARISSAWRRSAS